MNDHKMIYACAIMSHTHKDNAVIEHVIAATFWAVSEDEAIGKGVRLGEVLFPSAEGYGPSVVSVTPLPYDMAQRVAHCVNTGQYGMDIDAAKDKTINE